MTFVRLRPHSPGRFLYRQLDEPVRTRECEVVTDPTGRLMAVFDGWPLAVDELVGEWLGPLPVLRGPGPPLPAGNN